MLLTVTFTKEFINESSKIIFLNSLAVFPNKQLELLQDLECGLWIRKLRINQGIYMVIFSPSTSVLGNLLEAPWPESFWLAVVKTYGNILGKSFLYILGIDTVISL